MRYFTKDELRSLFVMDDANYRCQIQHFEALLREIVTIKFQCDVCGNERDP